MANNALPLMDIELKPAAPMQVLVRPFSSPPGEHATVVELSSTQDTVQSVISLYCVQKGVPYDPKLVIFDENRRLLPRFSTVNTLGIRNGQSLLIGQKYEDSSRVKASWPILISIVALLVGAVGVCVLIAVYVSSGGVYPLKHAVVMDAGSTKTNVIEYHWKGDKAKGTGIVSQGPNCYAKGGIAKMKPMKLNLVYECTKKVTVTIDPKERAETPLFFAATAGMRLLNLTNPNEANAILEQLHNHLNETELDVKTIEIISGRDEGLYGWITVNFLANTLEKQQKIDPWIPTTLGALDMGGASMQIAFSLPPDQSNVTKDEEVDLKLYGQKHKIFSRTNLCFGREEAVRRFRACLVDDPRKKDISDPCAPKGFTETSTGNDLFNQPCTESTKFKDWIKKYPDLTKDNFTITGTSDYTSCVKRISDLLDDAKCLELKFKECFKKLENPPKDQKYMAFATYWFTTNFLNLTKSSLEEYESTTKTFCLLTNDELKKKTDNPYAAQYCFNAQYIHEVLMNGLGFENNSWANLEFVGEIAGTDVGWTLGYMINATNFIPETNPSARFLSPAAITISLLALFLLAIAAIAFLVHSQWRKKNRHIVNNPEHQYGT